MPRFYHGFGSARNPGAACIHQLYATGTTGAALEQLLGIPIHKFHMTVSSQDMTRAQLEDVIALCSGVFELDYRYYMDLCPERVHVLGYEGGRLVSHALWLDRRMRVGGGPWRLAAYIEGVATHPDYEGRGYGSAVMRRIAQEISGYAFGALSPAVPEWYERLGWVRWRGPLLIERDGVIEETTDPDELVMVYRTPLTGDLDITASLTAEWRPFELW